MTQIGSVNDSLIADIEPNNENLNPLESKVQNAALEPLRATSTPPRQNKRLISPKNESPLLRKRSINAEQTIHIMPPTPCRKKAARPQFGAAAAPTPINNFPLVVTSFGKELPGVASTRIQELQRITGHPFQGRVYQLPSGKLVTAIQQPIQEKPTCGPGAVLMMAMDHFENLESLASKEPFWHWYGTTRISNSEAVLMGLQTLDISARIYRLSCNPLDDQENTPLIEKKVVDSKGALALIKATLAETGKPVILAITHPILKGHWIVVDSIENEHVSIRDPYTGMGFSLPENALGELLFRKDLVQDMVYFA